jgi:ring-1,2-phenylacetyl-CoA epoxidase subunit PaaE
MSKDFHSLQVKKITRETPDAVTVTFNIPEELKEEFIYTQGQYLTLKMQMNGSEVRRAYSMCSSPLDPDISVTVKKVEGGKMSPFINDQLQEGSEIEVMTPDGRFFTPLDEANKKTYYLFGAGSGITPLMSILRTVLEKEPLSKVFLLYGNRNETSIIFKEALDQLEKKYEGQLKVAYTLSQPLREKSKGLSGLFSKGKTSWTGQVGRINNKAVRQFLEDNKNPYQEAEYFICGPGSMIDTVEQALENLQIDQKHIHAERFVNASDKAKSKIKGVEGAQLTVHLDGEVHTLTVPPNKTVLDAILDKKYDAPYSCTAGACSTCMAKVLKGSAKMDACYALDDEEIVEGFILTCQAHPTSEELEITYEV